MADAEKAVTIPLDDAWKVAYKRRAKKCISIIRNFVARHEKVDAGKVKIGQQLNQSIWARGIKSPPREVKVQTTARESERGKEVWIELVGVALPEKKEAKKEKAKGALAALRERVAEAKAAEPKAKKTEDKDKVEAAAEEQKAPETPKAPEAKEKKPREKKSEKAGKAERVEKAGKSEVAVGEAK